MTRHLIVSYPRKENKDPMKTKKTMQEQSMIKNRTSKTILSARPVWVETKSLVIMKPVLFLLTQSLISIIKRIKLTQLLTLKINSSFRTPVTKKVKCLRMNWVVRWMIRCSMNRYLNKWTNNLCKIRCINNLLLNQF